MKAIGNIVLDYNWWPLKKTYSIPATDRSHRICLYCLTPMYYIGPDIGRRSLGGVRRWYLHDPNEAPICNVIRGIVKGARPT